MRTVQRLIAVLLVSGLMGISTLGCNTFRGMGQDIQSGGRGVENAAEDVQHSGQH